MKRAGQLSKRTRASLICFIFPLATTPIFYGQEFETIASWYGPGFQGRRTADGERFDQNRMTAASKTLPFGTSVLVVNPKNDRQCTVVINDRGPYVPGRGIDLSRAAARKLGIGGIAPVICYVGGKAYSDTAHKRKRHEQINGAPENEPSVPSQEIAETAQNLPQNASTTGTPAIVTENTQASIVRVSSAQPNTESPSLADQPRAVEVTDGRGQLNTTNNNSSVVPQPSLANEKTDLTTSNVNHRVDNAIQVVSTDGQPIPMQTPRQVPQISKGKIDISTGVPRLVNRSNRMFRPGALLAAATTTTYVNSSATPQAGTPTYTFVQSPGRYLVPISERMLAIPPVQAAPSGIEPHRHYSTTTYRYRAVAHSAHRFKRSSYFGGSASHLDMIDRAKIKIVHVCKNFLAKL